MHEFRRYFAIMFFFSKSSFSARFISKQNRITHEDTTHVVYVVSVVSKHQYDIHLDNDNKNHNVFHPFELNVRQLHFLEQLPANMKISLYFRCHTRKTKRTQCCLRRYRYHPSRVLSFVAYHGSRCSADSRLSNVRPSKQSR